ncbi:reverse transcriptase domain-containing protein [Tanacetum coccineum]
MAKKDEEKTAFTISQGIFCYSKMPFGLKKNTGASYQRLVDKAFQRQIGRNLEWTKKSDFQWTQEAEAAFKQMKKLIAELPMLSAPKENEELIVYLAAAKEAISAVLMTDMEGKQVPVYFVSRALRGPEINYTPMEKLVLALLSASKRLKRYF